MIADLIVLFHFAFVVFVVLGGLLALRWPRVVWLHVPAVIWGALVEFTGWICPLTPLENRLRAAAGESGYEGDFIAHYILPALYPNGLTRTDQLMLGGVALAINVAIYTVVITRKGRRARGKGVKAYDRARMNWDFQGWPASARSALLTVAVIAVAYVVGRIAKFIVSSQLTGLGRRTGGRWIDPIGGAVTRRIPFWSVLVGIYLAADFWILAPNIATAFDKALYVIAAASFTFLASEVLVKLVRTHGPTIDPALPVTTLTENLVRIVVVIVGLLVILAGLGLSITPMLATLGVGGLAVALALQDTLANLFAGVYLTVAKHIRIGNYIKLSSGEEGYLVDIDWRASRLRQLSNNTVLVPNAKLSQSIVTNYNFPENELVVTIDASVDYTSDLDRVESIAIEVARDVMRTVPGGVAGFDPLVRFHTFGDPGIGFSVILRAQEFVDQYLIKHEFVKRLHKRFLAEGVIIPIKSLVQRHDTPPPQ